MSHRNHLLRRDLYAYGYREDEAWGNDRRELEAALWEIDQLERQTEYEYQRPSPSHPWTSGRASAWGLPNARYPNVQMTRSNSDLYSNSESGMTSLSSQSYALYNNDPTSFEGYQRAYGHRTYPPSYGVPSMFCGYPGSQSSTDFCNSINTSDQNHFVPSIAPSSSYGHSQHSSPRSPAQQISTPGQLQMVTRGSDPNRSLSPEHTTTASSMMSPHWSTEGTARSGSPSVTSSQGRYYGQNLRNMRYGGYVESFDGNEFYGSSDEEYASDGYYYSSESGPESDQFSESSDDDDFYSSE